MRRLAVLEAHVLTQLSAFSVGCKTTFFGDRQRKCWCRMLAFTLIAADFDVHDASPISFKALTATELVVF